MSKNCALIFGARILLSIMSASKMNQGRRLAARSVDFVDDNKSGIKTTSGGVVQQQVAWARAFAFAKSRFHDLFFRLTAGDGGHKIASTRVSSFLSRIVNKASQLEKRRTRSRARAHAERSNDKSANQARCARARVSAVFKHPSGNLSRRM